MRDFAQPVSSWVNQCGVNSSSDMLLQMDIEGAEYDFFLCETSSFLKRFRYIVFELHYLHNMLTEANFESRLMPFLKKIQGCFDIVHIHPNTNTVFASVGRLNLTHCLEITLANKEIKSQHSKFQNSVSIKKYAKHPLDALNITTNNEIDLPDLEYLEYLVTNSTI